jgi:hypothetical protein
MSRDNIEGTTQSEGALTCRKERGSDPALAPSRLDIERQEKRSRTGESGQSQPDGATVCDRADGRNLLSQFPQARHEAGIGQ